MTGGNRFLKYLPVFTIPVVGYFSILSSGIWTYGLLIYAFGILPALEFVLPVDARNLSKKEEELIKKDRIYDFLLYLMVPIQYLGLGLFLWEMKGDDGLAGYEIVGKVVSHGILCGVLGINVAHELGHRSTKWERGLAKLLLLTSQYMHFIIEHNRGHHRYVATRRDPASARYGEPVYFFWVRSVFTAYFSAWKLENQRLRKKGRPIFSFGNEMLRFLFIQAGLLVLILLITDWQIMLFYLGAAIIGFLLLETVNYVEHYGLSRKLIAENRYEKVMPVHSWNSDHLIGRVVLFELTRHSDHHYHAGRKYQVLRHFSDSPQLPAGYPAMMLLSLIPPLWFWIMHREIRKLHAAQLVTGS